MENTTLEVPEIEISKEELDSMRLKAIISTRKHVNTLLQASGQKVAEGVKVRLEPKTELERIRESLKRQLVATGVVPA